MRADIENNSIMSAEEAPAYLPQVCRKALKNGTVDLDTERA